MRLVQLVYFSRSTDRVDVREVLQIVETARRHNSQVDITGALLFSHDYFLQALEGPADPVNALYRKILVDPRHTGPTLLSYGDVEKRDFGKWSMAFCSHDRVHRDLLVKFGGQDSLRPAQLQGDAAVGLLQAVVGEADARAQNSHNRSGKV